LRKKISKFCFVEHDQAFKPQPQSESNLILP